MSNAPSPAAPNALPPGPRSSLFSILDYLRDPVECLVPYRNRYGDVFTFPGSPPVVMVGDPAGIKALYSADPDSLAPFSVELADLLGPRSLFFLSGAEHRRARKLMAPPFHGARMRAYGDTIRRLTEARIAPLRAGDRAAMLPIAQDISLDVILQAIFGVTAAAEMKDLRALLLDITNGISPLVALFPKLRREFGGIGPYASFLRRKERLHARLDALIAARRAEGPRDDILSLLVGARYDDGAAMADDEIRDHLVLLVFAGHETTAIAIAWALYALHRPENADALARLRGELAQAGPSPDGEALAKLPYLEAVCNETLRRWPLAPAPNVRKLLRPLDVGGWVLPAGTGVAAGIGAVHFKEDIYPEPMRFRPERFLERTFTPFEFIPFGGGARRCLGAALAMYEIKLVLGTMLRALRLRLASSRADRGKVRAANVGPATGIKMIVEERLA